MKYISFIVNEDAAHDCLADLGRIGVIQFTDVSLAICVKFFINDSALSGPDFASDSSRFGR